MALAIIPRTLPSLEAYKAALCAALDANWTDAAAAVAAAYPSPALTLTKPQGFAAATIERYEAVPKYPYCTVEGYNVRVAAPHEVHGSGVWEGTIEVAVFVQESDRAKMAAYLDRYAAAVWLIAVNTDPLAGARLDYGSVAMETAEPAGNTANRRAVSVMWDVRFRT